MTEDKLTVVQAYKAMYVYLDNLYKLTNSDDLAGFLGGMSLLSEGGTADPAVWGDWLEAIEQASSPDTDISLKIIPN